MPGSDGLWMRDRKIVSIWSLAACAFILFQGLFGWMGYPEALVRAGYLPLAVLPLLLPFTVPGLALFMSNRGRNIIAGLNIYTLTLIHAFRIVIGGVLFMGFLDLGGIPREMTALGRNPDLFVGLSAPIVAWAFSRGWLSRKALLLWNILSLGCLVNIIAVAILSMPSQFQIFGMSQPNVAVLRFPFVLLPGFLVPVALLSHLYSFARLLQKQSQQTAENSLQERPFSPS